MNFMQLDYNESAEVRNHHIEKNISNANQHDTNQPDQVYLTPIKEVRRHRKYFFLCLMH
jgi:hypothetical protein